MFSLSVQGCGLRKTPLRRFRHTRPCITSCADLRAQWHPTPRTSPRRFIKTSDARATRQASTCLTGMPATNLSAMPSSRQRWRSFSPLTSRLPPQDRTERENSAGRSPRSLSSRIQRSSRARFQGWDTSVSSVRMQERLRS